ncbi:hypothetical protein TNCV_1570801 [Trichonephila clavipes]|uniref:Uncharacterized protein n=1 Tax=Trichonephila clavipes TaxID=2585209 RepID=A0A8X6SK76_TRICX|nr:hypothetical protein TNCV_1570801 [Trichonephila clavipes]
MAWTVTPRLMIDSKDSAKGGGWEEKRNEVTGTTDQHCKLTETSSRTRGHETTPLRAKEDIKDVTSELDDGGEGVKSCTSWMKRQEFYCSR